MTRHRDDPTPAEPVPDDVLTPTEQTRSRWAETPRPLGDEPRHRTDQECAEADGGGPVRG